MEIESRDARDYELKSIFTEHPIVVTLSWVEKDGKKKPYEIFINCTDPELTLLFTMMTRLISAIFRKQDKVFFILEELSGIATIKPGGFANKKYKHSIPAEIADVIERFFNDIGYKE